MQYHENTPCDFSEIFNNAVACGGRICPFCYRIIYKTKDCNHITCPCGNHWCYACPLGKAFGSNNAHRIYDHMTKMHGGWYCKPVDYVSQN